MPRDVLTSLDRPASARASLNNLDGQSASRYSSSQFFASFGNVDRRKKSRENREQLRCCNWIRLPIWANPRRHFGGEGGNEVRCRTGMISQEPEYLSGPPHSL